MDGLQGHKYLEIIDLEENEVMYLFVCYYFIFFILFHYFKILTSTVSEGILKTELHVFREIFTKFYMQT